MMPWRDRSGGLSPLRLCVFLGVLAPAAWLCARTLAGDLGPEPLKEATHVTGLWAIRLLFCSLAVTPARTLLGWPRLVSARRMIGVAAFSYAALHLGLFVVDQQFDVIAAGREIVLRIYLTIGFAALVALTALAATSTDGAIRRLGKRWRRLHRLAYPAALIATIHYFLQSKVNVSEPVLMAGFLVWLLGYRLAGRGRPPSLAVLAVLALGAGALTAGIEAGWYALATGVDARRVLAANLDLAYGLRPALWVAAAASATVLLVLARKGRARLRATPVLVRGQSRLSNP